MSHLLAALAFDTAALNEFWRRLPPSVQKQLMAGILKVLAIGRPMMPNPMNPTFAI